MERNEVSTAFEIVLEEVEAVVDSLNNEGAEVFRKGDSPKGIWEISEKGRTALRNREKL